ncbi:MAG: hypothetical protein WCD67_15535 [Xanthobacteraceae bacterium]
MSSNTHRQVRANYYAERELIAAKRTHHFGIKPRVSLERVDRTVP